ncbi:hypothetical protein GH733_018996, partial [Mirounga leonina]
LIQIRQWDGEKSRRWAGSLGGEERGPWRRAPRNWLSRAGPADPRLGGAPRPVAPAPGWLRVRRESSRRAHQEVTLPSGSDPGRPLAFTWPPQVFLWLAGIKRRVPMHSPRCFLSRVGLLPKPGSLPWCATKPPGWSQPFLGSACEGNFTDVIPKKCQRGQKSQKKPSRVKFEAQKRILRRLESYLQKLNGVNVTTSAPRAEGLSCLLHPITPSSTFSVNRGPDGNPKTVGYYLGTWRDRSIVCVWSNHLKNIPEKHNQVA